MTRLSSAAQAALKLAGREAAGLGNGAWGSEHVLLALTQIDRDDAAGAAAILARLGLSESRVRALLYRHLPHVDADEDAIPPASAEIGYVITHARWIAILVGDRVADSRHLLLGVLWHDKPASIVMRSLDVTFEDAYTEVTGQRPPAALKPNRAVFVPVKHLEGLLAKLPMVIPEGSWGWAADAELAWFSTTSDIDLAHCVQYALSLLDE